jgi:hypothetical protein
VAYSLSVFDNLASGAMSVLNRVSARTLERLPHIVENNREPDDNLDDWDETRIALRPARVDPRCAWSQLPRRILFVNVETFRGGGSGNIVRFGAVRLTTDPLDVATLHLVFNPHRRGNPLDLIARVFADASARRPESFDAYARALADYFAGVDLIVAHDAAIGVKLINRHFERAGLTPVETASECTMLEWRYFNGGAADIDSIIAELGLTRSQPGSALEQAWLTMQVFLHLRGIPFGKNFSAVGDPGPANLRPAAAAARQPRMAPAGSHNPVRA